MRTVVLGLVIAMVGCRRERAPDPFVEASPKTTTKPAAKKSSKCHAECCPFGAWTKEAVTGCEPSKTWFCDAHPIGQDEAVPLNALQIVGKHCRELEGQGGGHVIAFCCAGDPFAK